MSKWMVWMKKADFKGLGQKYGIDPVLARIMVNRGVQPDDFDAYLHPSMEQLHDPHMLKDADLSADLLLESIQKHEKIRIIGDYDIDGIQSVYILHQALLRCSADADYAVPERLKDGYGMNVRLVNEAFDSGVQTLITCDNGIAAGEAIDRAKELGMTVIVTDHHNVPYDEVDGKRMERIPRADAVVDPKQEACAYPFTGICGAVVAWKLVCILYEKAGIDSREADHFIENAAFATIGDVMELVDENRSIVALGLKALRHTSNPGMRALIARQGIEADQISAYHIGFVLGPCFNASGRLNTAALGICLLEAKDPQEAEKLAEELGQLNDERKEMTQKGVDAAFAQIDGMEQMDKVLVVYIPGIHESVAGIVAGRVREKYSRPTFVLCDAADGTCVKGSGRSVEAYSMYDEMNRCKGLLLKFGGHPMAAGLSIARENVDAFRRQLNENTTLTEEDLMPVVHIDVPMPLSYISIDLIRQLSLLEPCGNGNTQPVFAAKNVPVVSARRIGREGQFLKFRLGLGEGTGRTIDCLYFGDVDAIQQVIVDKFGEAQWDAMLNGEHCHVTLSVIYEPQINSYRGMDSVQVIMREVC